MYQQMRAPESDHTLLNAFATRQCQRAFAALVERHGAMVHSAALRQVRRRDLADDVTQAVFILLADRAGSISSRIVLAAWLHKTCRYVALNALKMERRRIRHEQRAAIMNAEQQSPAAGWSHLCPILDEGIERLGESDRTAIILRFLQNRSLADVGRQMGVSEDAAQMRVSRALDRLRAFFQRRGIGLSTANLGIVLGLHVPSSIPSTMPANLAALATHARTSTSFSSIPTSARAIELARQMNRTYVWESVRSAGLALATAAAVFAMICTATNWWMRSPEPMRHRPAVELADASSAPAPSWLEAHAIAPPLR